LILVYEYEKKVKESGLAIQKVIEKE